MEKQLLLWRWQYVVPIVLLVFTAIWGLYAAYLQKPQGRLDFSLDSNTVIASIPNGKQSRLQLLYVLAKTYDFIRLGRVDLCR